MKTVALVALLLLSLAANGVLISRRLTSRSRGGDAKTMTIGTEKPAPAMILATTPTAETPASAQDRLTKLVAKLRASGLSAELIRVWVTAEVDELYRPREQALKPARKEKYWQPEPVVPLATQFAQMELRLEKSRMLDELLGYDPGRPENAPYTFLPLDKQAAVKRVSAEYSAKLELYRAATSGMATAREEAEMARLEGEKKQALGGLLTDAEQRQLDVRVTLADWHSPEPSALGVATAAADQPVVDRIRKSLRAFDATEQEFIAIDEIETEFEPYRRLGGMDTTELNQRVNDRIRAALGDERFAQYQQKSDSDFANISDLVTRLGLPSARAAEVATLREHALTESARIGDDSSLDVAAKRAALKSFAESERARIATLLGADGATAIASYTNRWLRPLEQGNVLSATRGMIATRPVSAPPLPARPGQ